MQSRAPIPTEASKHSSLCVSFQEDFCHFTEQNRATRHREQSLNSLVSFGGASQPSHRSNCEQEIFRKIRRCSTSTNGSSPGEPKVTYLWSASRKTKVNKKAVVTLVVLQARIATAWKVEEHLVAGRVRMAATFDRSHMR